MNTIKLNTIGTPKVSAGNGGGTASTMEYFSAQDAPQLIPFMSIVKASRSSGAFIQIMPYIPSVADKLEPYVVLAFGVDFQSRTTAAFNEQKMEASLLEAVIQETGLSADQIAAIPRITEEEFYNLNVEE